MAALFVAERHPKEGRGVVKDEALAPHLALL